MSVRVGPQIYIDASDSVSLRLHVILTDAARNLSSEPLEFTKSLTGAHLACAREGSEPIDKFDLAGRARSVSIGRAVLIAHSRGSGFDTALWIDGTEIVDNEVDLIELFLHTVRQSGHTDPPTDPAAEDAAALAMAVERLLHHMYALLDERDELRKLLAGALWDLDVAAARVEQLESAYDGLFNERYRTKHWLSKETISSWALVVVTLVGPIAGVLVGHRLGDDARQAVIAAQQVQVECGNVVIEGPPPSTAPYPGGNEHDYSEDP